jgi:hypothetical protein
MEKNEATATTTASHRLSFVGTAVKCSEESIGTTVVANPSSDATSAN